ncbi:MAG: hypothetical protein VX733_01760 [Candidatus Latescibacterota bacterium]|nr:hypothetical protein [Candidatus Latescibacterota bacterium]
MWLGICAILAAFAFALVKFFTSMHMRQISTDRARLHSEVKKAQERHRTIDKRLRVERSRRSEVEQKLSDAQRFKDDLYERLHLELSSDLQGELRQCMNRNPIPEPTAIKVAHELRLADRVTEALGQLTIMLMEFHEEAQDGSSSTVRLSLTADFVKLLDSAEQHYIGPAPRDTLHPTKGPQLVTTAFDEPESAVSLVRQFSTAVKAEHADQVRGVLLSGVKVTQFDRDHATRLFARAFNSALNLLESAVEGAVILNQQAYDLIDDRSGVEEYSKVERLWMLHLLPKPSKNQDANVNTSDGESPAEECDSEGGRDKDEASGDALVALESPPAEVANIDEDKGDGP